MTDNSACSSGETSRRTLSYVGAIGPENLRFLPEAAHDISRFAIVVLGGRHAQNDDDRVNVMSLLQLLDDLRKRASSHVRGGDRQQQTDLMVSRALDER